MKNIVVIGGGHGQSIILNALKQIENINITAIVTVADNGGSTGRIRQRYKIPGMGDIRNVLVSLSKSDDLFSKLMDFRFDGDKEDDITGHSLGNLILTALTKITGSFSKSVELLSSILKINGQILPSTLENVDIYAKMDDDTIVKGEENIPNYIHHIKEIFYDHDVCANRVAMDAIMDADLVLFGIGSLYTSIIPNIIIKGIKEALLNTKAKKIYFANCMNQNNETYGYDLKDHYDALVKHGAVIDLIVKHNNLIPRNILQRYENDNACEVCYNNNLDVEVLQLDLLKFDDGYVRHDPNKLKNFIQGLL